MPSSRVKDLIKDFDLAKVFTVRSRRPYETDARNAVRQLPTMEAMTISVDITNDFRFVSPLHSNLSPREPGPEVSTNASFTGCTWGEPSRMAFNAGADPIHLRSDGRNTKRLHTKVLVPFRQLSIYEGQPNSDRNFKTWTLNTAREVFAPCLAVWVVFKHFRELR
ncbi:uncharacterized protein BJ212DRAFT_1483560 [Suillus subaureus]|uniref:Uncharacterized protein n=1 Tax=Suillus subaureus TaxID=48587 RepID=A0A9P7JAZ7_9AGAM|nr:uncharacterized protein BJ212DRAFT_1483560 [Suillus subaureus]KAG1811850.1 hypothetical protein BJ212DRAFT_1483560 [Suillus subaureus]